MAVSFSFWRSITAYGGEQVKADGVMYLTTMRICFVPTVPTPIAKGRLTFTGLVSRGILSEFLSFRLISDGMLCYRTFPSRICQARNTTNLFSVQTACRVTLRRYGDMFRVCFSILSPFSLTWRRAADTRLCISISLSCVLLYFDIGLLCFAVQLPGMGLNGPCEFKLTFQSGGAATFLHFLFRIIEDTRVAAATAARESMLLLGVRVLCFDDILVD